MVRPCHYRALAGMLLRFPGFPRELLHYLTGRGNYPHHCRVRTPLGIVAPELFSHHDLLTLNEVFCRQDYPAGESTGVVVDIGSNIGLSALYFLTRNTTSRCYLFEPDPRNLGRLGRNLFAYRDRYIAEGCAVGPEEAEVDFERDPTGRYGAVSPPSSTTVRIRCRSINSVLTEVIDKEGKIDILKIDTEGLEVPTLLAVDPVLLDHVARIYYEAPAEGRIDLPGYHHRYSCETHRLISETFTASLRSIRDSNINDPLRRPGRRR